MHTAVCFDHIKEEPERKGENHQKLSKVNELFTEDKLPKTSSFVEKKAHIYVDCEPVLLFNLLLFQYITKRLNLMVFENLI